MRRIVLIPSNATGAFAEGEVAWAWRSAADSDRGITGSFAELSKSETREDDEVIVVVPGTDATLHAVAIPARSESQARLAASFALEDEVAVDREKIHFALGAPVDPGSPRQVIAVGAEALASWLAALKSVGIAARALIPDYLILPAEDGILHLAERNGQILARCGDAIGLSLEKDTLALILPGLVKRYDIRQAKLFAAAAGEIAALLEGAGCAVETYPPLGDAALCETALDRAGTELNLLQGLHAPRRPFWKGVEQWRRAAALAAAVLVFYGGYLVAEGWGYAREAGRIEARAEAALMTAFPDIDRVVNPRAQMRARLDAAGSGSADVFYELAAMVYAGVDSLSDVEIQAMQFDNGRGELAVDLLFRAYAELEQLRNSIVELGGIVEEGGSRQNGDMISGEIRVRAR